MSLFEPDIIKKLLIINIFVCLLVVTICTLRGTKQQLSTNSIVSLFVLKMYLFIYFANSKKGFANFANSPHLVDNLCLFMSGSYLSFFFSQSADFW